MTRGIRILAATLLGSAATFVVSEARAQEVAANAGGPEEIIVTAQKRASTVQTTPISISAFSGADLQDRGINSLAELAQGTPGVSLKSEGPSQTEIEMRGMTSSGGNSATVGFYLDDVPLSGPASAQNGHVIIDPDLYDLNRIEILRGPQGTLFGSGSMGGTVRLITNQPDTNGFDMSAEGMVSGTDGGGLNHKENVMVNVPLADNLALRVVGTEQYTSGWIDRVVVSPFPSVQNGGTVRGDVQNAPVVSQYPGSNAYLVYGVRTSLLWQPTSDLTVTPSIFFETTRQNGISAYDSVSGGASIPSYGEAHYQPFDIPEPLKDKIAVYSLSMNYSFTDFDVTSSTAYWNRRSSQVEEASEAFNSPVTGVTNYATGVAAACSGQSYYGPCGSGPEAGVENDPTRQWTSELRFASKGEGPLSWVGGLYYSDYWSLWTFNGTTPNFASFTDVGTLVTNPPGLPATTPNWFDAHSPTYLAQYAAFADATYALTDAFKIDAGVRLNRFVYRFSSCISGWGSAQGAATPSCTGLIPIDSNSFTPKLNLSYTFSSDLMLYGTVAEGFRPGGGNAIYPTTGPVWGPAFAAMHYTSGEWPRTYKSDSVWSYEIGEKSRLFDRLTLNSSIYYENWRQVQLEAYPDDWAMIINGNHAQIYGGDVDLYADLGAGFNLQFQAGYLHETLDGGPHWDIPPIHRLPEVAPVSGTVIVSYTTQLDSHYSLTARVENSYTGQRYSLTFPVQDEATGAYTPMAAYDLTNVRLELRCGDSWTASLFVDNVFNKHAELEGMFTENLPTTPYTRIETNQPLTGGVDVSYNF